MPNDIENYRDGREQGWRDKEAEIARLRAALEFYSKQENYMEVRGPAGIHSYQIKAAEVMCDHGEIARQALTPDKRREE